MHLLSYIQTLRREMKKSRFKIWLRAFLFVQFSAIFGFYFLRDFRHGYFSWVWVVILYALFIPVGLWMSRLVPMQADMEMKAITLSLDKTYLALIWILVIAKLILGRIPSLVFVADIIMCSILGIMSGRLGGTGLRVRQLKIKHGLIVKGI